MKPLLWHEPAKYRRAKFRQRERGNPMESVKLAVFTFLFILGLRGLAGIHPAPDAHPPDWTATADVAFGMAIFVPYILPRFIGLFAISIVTLSEKGVNNNIISFGVTLRFWPWQNIAFGYLWTEELYGNAYRVLSFCDSESIVLTTVCLSAATTENDIQRVLNTYNIPLQRDPAPATPPLS